MQVAGDKHAARDPGLRRVDGSGTSLNRCRPGWGSCYFFPFFLLFLVFLVFLATPYHLAS